HRHGGGAEHDRDVERDFVDGCHGCLERIRDKSPWDGYEQVNMRAELPLGLEPRRNGPAAEWMVAGGPVPYADALARMDARVAAIAAGTAPELVWLIEHPALYTAGTSARPGELIEARFPVFPAGRGGQFTYHGPGQRVA